MSETQSAAPLSAEEWQHEASMALAAFVTLSATPDDVEWGKVAIHATKLLNVKLANRQDNAELVKRLHHHPSEAHHMAPNACPVCREAATALERGVYGEAATLTVGDLVKGINNTVLACGSGVYPYAVVVQVEPLILVSEEADMLWSATTKEMELQKIGTASARTLNGCLRRLKHYTDPTGGRKDD